MSTQFLALNPGFNFAVRTCWVPALALGSIGFLFEQPALSAVLLLGPSGFGAGVLLAARMRARKAVRDFEAYRQRMGLRYVCPRCLCRGAASYACAHCSEPLDAGAVATRGALGDQCPRCNQRLFPEGARDGQVNARCLHCGQLEPGTTAHRVGARLVGALSRRDFAALAAATRMHPVNSEGINHFIKDGNPTLVGLCCEDLSATGRQIPADHALRRLDFLLTCEADPLSLGRAVDAFLAHAGLTEAERATITVSMQLPNPDPAALRVLQARFPKVRTDIGLSRILAQDPPPGSDGGN